MAIEPEEEGRPWADEDGGPIKSFLEHLEDFRWALIKSSAAIFVAVLVCMLGGNYVVRILKWPLTQTSVAYPGTNKVVTLNFGTNRLGVFQLDNQQERALAALDLGTNRYAEIQITPKTITVGTNTLTVLGLDVKRDFPLELGSFHPITERLKRLAGLIGIHFKEKPIVPQQRMTMDLIVLSPAEAFLTGFHIALYAGIAIASPLVLFFIGQFVLPALKVNEKRYLNRGLLFAVPLFLTGVSFCYFVLMPVALLASQAYANWFGFSSTMWNASEFINFECKFLLGMGVGFELPVVILICVKLGLLSYSTLKKARPYMIVINLVLGAVLTTPEVVTQVLMAVPLQLLFEISVFIAWYWERQDKKREAKLEADMTDSR